MTRNPSIPPNSSRLQRRHTYAGLNILDQLIHIEQPFRRHILQMRSFTL